MAQRHLIWLVQLQTLAIPARIFPDDAARKAFVTAMQARIDAAAQPPQTGGVASR